MAGSYGRLSIDSHSTQKDTGDLSLIAHEASSLSNLDSKLTANLTNLKK